MRLPALMYHGCPKELSALLDKRVRGIITHKDLYIATADYLYAHRDEIRFDPPPASADADLLRRHEATLGATAYLCYRYRAFFRLIKDFERHAQWGEIVVRLGGQSLLEDEARLQKEHNPGQCKPGSCPTCGAIVDTLIDIAEAQQDKKGVIPW